MSKTATDAHDDGKCPNCGACQHCGNGGAKVVPYPVYPWPVPYTQPYRAPYTQPYWSVIPPGGATFTISTANASVSGTWFGNTH